MAALLPNGMQVFLLNNGEPAALGTVEMYVPNTSTPKTTWQDVELTTQNTNPINLDANGRAVIFGVGRYRQIFKDADGNTIWDKITSDGIDGTEDRVEDFEGDGTTTAFVLEDEPVSENNTFIFISGNYQQKNTYTIDEDTINFTEAPPADESTPENIEVCYRVAAEIDGIITTASNVGGEAEVFKQVDGSDLQFRTLLGGTGVTITQQAFTLRIDATGSGGGGTESFIVACSDEVSSLTTGSAKATIRMPYDFVVDEVRGSLTTAQTSGSIMTMDIQKDGVSILSTLLTIDNGEKTSTTAATPAVIDDAGLNDDSEITFDITQIGDGTATGLKMYLIGTQGVVPPSGDIGIDWTSRSSAADINWMGVCYSPELTLFVAVASSGTGNRVMTSPDGITWTIRTSAADNAWESVCWSPELTLFVAVSSSGTGNRVMTSPDGINWTIRVSAANKSWQDVCWSPELGLFVAVAKSTSVGFPESNIVMTSPDGINWTSQSPSGSARGVCWSPELGLFVLVSDTVAGGSNNGPKTSPDGINWTNRSGPPNVDWNSVCWSPELGLFVAVGFALSANCVMTSPDGITWTIRTGILGTWTSVAWMNSSFDPVPLFVAVSSTGKIITSPDGIAWTERTAPAANAWQSVCWSADQTLFVAVSSSGTGDRVMTSL